MKVRIQIVGGTEEESKALHEALMTALKKFGTLEMRADDAINLDALFRAPVSCESNNTEQLLMLANVLRECSHMVGANAVKHLMGNVPNLTYNDSIEFLEAAKGYQIKC